MNIIKKIKEAIFKVKDYDRLESDYCKVIDMVTGSRLSKPCYMDSVRDAFYEFIDEYAEHVNNPAETVAKILDRIGKDGTWMVVSLRPNGRDTHFFHSGYEISKKDLSEREMSDFITWVGSAYHSMQNGKGFNP